MAINTPTGTVYTLPIVPEQPKQPTRVEAGGGYNEPERRKRAGEALQVNQDGSTAVNTSGVKPQSTSGSGFFTPGDIVNPITQTTGVIGQGVEDVGKAAGVAGDILGNIGAGLGLGTPTRPDLTAYQLNSNVAQGNWDLLNKPTTMQQVVGGGNITGQIPTVMPGLVNGAQMNLAGANAAGADAAYVRNQQMGANRMLMAAAQGNVPSAAAIQSRAALDRATQQQLALASSARGGAAQRAAAMRQAQTSIGDLQQGAISQTAALRAQEQTQARGELTNALYGTRGQDAATQQLLGTQALQQAQLNQQAQLSNQSTALSAGLGNQQAILSGLTSDQANAFRVQQANQAAGLQAQQITDQRQQAAMSGLLDYEQLAQRAYMDPLALQTQMYQSDRQAQAAMTGAVIQGGAGLLDAIIPG